MRVLGGILLIVLAVWPYRADLALHTSETDGVVWMTRGAPWNPGWLDWALHEAHFVGWRPLTALSFTLDGWIGGRGWPAAVYRVTDTLLHVLAVLGLWPVARALGLGPRAAFGAAALFALHPAAAEVVPYLSRRSYSLCAALGLAATFAHLRALAGGWGWRAAAVALTGLAIAANEVGYLLLPWHALLALTQAPPGRRWAAAGLWAAEVGGFAALFATRYAVVGRVGGYRLGDAGWGREVAVVRETLEFLWLPTSTWVAPAWASSPAFLGFGALTALAGGALALADRRRDGAWRPLVWLAGYLVVYAWTEAWFFRMGYLPAIPLALAVAAALERATGGWRRAAGGLLAVGVGWIVLRSPVLGGVEPEALRFRQERHAVVEQLRADLAALPEAAVVYLVGPLVLARESNPLFAADARYGMKVLVLWARAWGEARRVDARPLGWVVPRRGEAPAPTVDAAGVTFPADTDVWLWPNRSDRKRREAAPFTVTWAELRRPTPRRPVYVYRLPDGALIPAP